MGEIIQMDQNTWRIEDDEVRYFLLTGTERALLIDSGVTSPDARKVAEGLTDLPLQLLNTHADPDHIGGNGAFAEFYMSPAEEDYYRARGGQGTIIPVKEGDEIDLGDRVLRIIDVPGHTPGSIAVLDVKNRVLIGGDGVQDGTIFMFAQGRNIPQYIESLKHLLEYADAFDVVYPSHGSIPVQPDLIPKLIEGAGEILKGTVSGTPAEVFGNPVTLIQFPYAGFFCDPE